MAGIGAAWAAAGSCARIPISSTQSQFPFSLQFPSLEIPSTSASIFLFALSASVICQTEEDSELESVAARGLEGSARSTTSSGGEVLRLERLQQGKKDAILRDPVVSLLRTRGEETGRSPNARLPLCDLDEPKRFLTLFPSLVIKFLATSDLFLI